MMKESDFPDLQDLDSLHLEDYQLMQEKLNGKHEHFNKNNIYLHHDKPDLLIQDPSDSQNSTDPFKFDLLNGCTNDMTFIPHLETLESMLGSLHEDEIGIQEPQLFAQTFVDDFLQQSFDSNLSSNAPSTLALNGSVLELSRSNSTSPPITVKNQKRLSNFDSDDVFQVNQDDTGKKKKWSDVESTSSSIKVEFKVASLPKAATEKTLVKKAPKKSSDGETGPTGEKLPRHKRPSHINAEQRRRSKIQNCLDQLHEMVPAIISETSVQQGGSSKKSKASILYKTANCCRLLKSKTKDLESETDALRTEIKTLCRQIKECQSKLPENGATSTTSMPTSSAASSSKTGAPVPLNQRFEDYVHISTLRNWKFWIFSLFIRPMFNSYWNSTGLSGNLNDFKRHALLWLRDDCKLSVLRGTITNALLTVSSRTSAVGNASNLPVESIRESMRDAGIDLFRSPSRPDSR